MSALFNWFVGVTREHFAAAGVHTSANSGMDAVGNGGGDSATSPSQNSCGTVEGHGRAPIGDSNGPEVVKVPDGLSGRPSGRSEYQASPAGIIQTEMARVQRVMDAHNYAGSGLSKQRFDAEVSLGIERMRAEEGDDSA